MKDKNNINGIHGLVDLIYPALELAIRKTVKESLLEHEQEKLHKQGEPLYTINQVRKKLRKSHHSVKKYVESGLLRSTPNGLIPESAIEEFLNQQ